MGIIASICSPGIDRRREEEPEGGTFEHYLNAILDHQNRRNAELQEDFLRRLQERWENRSQASPDAGRFIFTGIPYGTGVNESQGPSSNSPFGGRSTHPISSVRFELRQSHIVFENLNDFLRISRAQERDRRNAHFFTRYPRPSAGEFGTSTESLRDEDGPRGNSLKNTEGRQRRSSTGGQEDEQFYTSHRHANLGSQRRPSRVEREVRGARAEEAKPERRQRQNEEDLESEVRKERFEAAQRSEYSDRWKRLKQLYSKDSREQKALTFSDFVWPIFPSEKADGPTENDITASTVSTFLLSHFDAEDHKSTIREAIKLYHPDRLHNFVLRISPDEPEQRDRVKKLGLRVAQVLNELSRNNKLI